MNLLTSMLHVLIGALAGGLLVLILDTIYLGQRLQKAVTAKRQMQAVLRRTERKLANLELKGQKLAQELNLTSGQPSTSVAAEEGDHLELEKARVEISMLRDNLTRVSNHADELHEERQVLRQDLAATKARVETLQEYQDRLDNELRELRQRYEDTCERLTAAEATRKHLEKEFGLAREKVELAGPLQIELHQLRFQLKAAEARVNQLESRQRKALDEIRQAAESESQTIMPIEATTQEERMRQPPDIELQAESAPTQTGDSADQDALEKVRGIGPVYARRLHEAGIKGLADLAVQDPEQISDIVGFKAGQYDRAVAWIEEARTLSGN